VPNFIAISLRRTYRQICEILRFCDFFIVLSCPVQSCPGYTFFLATPPRSNPWTDFNHLWLKWRVVTQGCAFWGFGWRPTILRGSKPPKNPKKGAWLVIFQPKWQNYVISRAENIGSIPNFDRVIEPHSWLRGWSRITKFKFKMADGRNIAKCWKRYNSPINALTGMKLWWSHPIMSPTYPPWFGCHGTGRCLATAHCTLNSYEHLEAERVNQFCWNLVYNSKLGPRWQSRNQILKFLKFKMADDCHDGKYFKFHNSPTSGPTGMQLGWSHPIMFSTCPPCCGCHSNGRCLATAYRRFCSYGRLETKHMNQFWWHLLRNSKLGPQWQSRD